MSLEWLKAKAEVLKFRNKNMILRFLCTFFQKYWNWKKCFVAFLCSGHVFVPGQCWTYLSRGDQPFCTLFIWHLEAADPCALPGISSIWVFPWPFCHPLSYMSPAVFITFVCTVLCRALFSMSLSLCASPLQSIRFLREYFYY